ncbi:Mrp/NBP35 family ATP-binding protein [Thermogymnomonas acidicola]|nr:Mrp/NBP35 family ATP-binding protein [Thermogymnomonas acidicola]
MPKGTIKINNPPPQPIIGPPPKSQKYKGVKHTIMVMSGKGGVGKSTVSVNLAVTLANQSLKTGLIDADINGPDDPKMLGADNEKLYAQGDKILPVKTRYGVDLVSMGFILPTEDTAVIWRGALRHKAIQQFLEDVMWGERDYVIIDMPPGTGDEALSVSQLIDADGVVIVVTPQDIALLDAKKAINFANQLKVPVLGIVENMSGFICPHCGQTVDIFKRGGGEKAAEAYGVPFLGRIPLVAELVEKSDQGIPAVVYSEEMRKIFDEIARKVREQVEKKPHSGTDSSM